MAQYPIVRRAYLFTNPVVAGHVVAVAAKAIINVKKGDRILFGLLQKRVLASVADTIALRVNTAGGGAAGGLLAAVSMSAGAVGNLLNLSGADLDSGGYLVTADTTIDLDYVLNGLGSATATQVFIDVGIVRHEQIS